MNSSPQSLSFKKLLLPFCLFVGLGLWVTPVNAQEQPPKPIEVKVTNYQPLNFGTFCYGDGSGTKVIISPDGGSRSFEGNIILLGNSFSAAIFDVEALPGTIITIADVDVTLTGTASGTMKLQIRNIDSYPHSPFIATSNHTTVSVGGTLIVGTSGANPPGIYGAPFFVTFIQQ